ncbi:MAG: hypothetical protein H6732_15600 [Alphaproteobacteria bacterium]|nr:hypothetical protein [Alphaproteobacteria bacterium]
MSPTPSPSVRDALVEALVPGVALRGPQASAQAWRDFAAAAPLHLRVGWWAATLVLGVVWPLALSGRRLAHLSPAAREVVLRRAAALPGLAALVEVARVCVCLVALDDDALRAARP